MKYRVHAALTTLLIAVASSAFAEQGKGIKSSDIIPIIFVIAAVGVAGVGLFSALIWAVMNAITGTRRAYWPVLAGTLFASFAVLVTVQSLLAALSIGCAAGLLVYMLSPARPKADPRDEESDEGPDATGS